VLAAAVARPLLGEDFIPDAPRLAQFLAHATLLQGVLGYESLSSGVWYVAIDFQLYALLALILSATRDAPLRRKLLVAALAVLSAFVFNLQSQYDDWAPYFWAAYGLGACAWWARARQAGARALFWGLVALTVVALEMNFRARLCLATLTAVALMLWSGQGPAMMSPISRLVAWLGKTSYALFLVHFPVLLLASALHARLESNSVSAAVALLVAAWAASMALSALFHRWVEIPLGRLSWGRRLETPPTSPEAAPIQS
jgi:peptidoglycan/LPS O-acetylase OafA/YrhL